MACVPKHIHYTYTCIYIHKISGLSLANQWPMAAMSVVFLERAATGVLTGASAGQPVVA